MFSSIETSNPFTVEDFFLKTKQKWKKLRSDALMLDRLSGRVRRAYEEEREEEKKREIYREGDREKEGERERGRERERERGGDRDVPQLQHQPSLRRDKRR